MTFAETFVETGNNSRLFRAAFTVPGGGGGQIEGGGELMGLLLVADVQNLEGSDKGRVAPGGYRSFRPRQGRALPARPW